MQMIGKSARSLELLIDLSWEQLVIPAAILMGLLGGAAIGVELMQMPVMMP
ncbi:hypothetical protein GVY41_04565 [Frigidibacter albus]|uniref:Uncharacterized protein n=1 Tax=Frigidibacter albus TaxID=1465486 RepID=A0A6L8VFI5_9RHOB|nr:hypothetical protein [Frigidibacter albus]MZQ88049.1 hypothetical protein [Frigidibacter albus]NBE30277.1 hypothetical protein [Frigidibacter albus]GGH47795.1 hypothetical protein GCM10011341_09170 [Frigidibacter albus]